MNKTVWSRVNPTVETSIRGLADLMGISVSEYVRKLILEDLDRRSFFTFKIKKVKSDAKE